MKKYMPFYIILLLALSHAAFAHGDEEHKEEVRPVSGSRYFTTESSSDKYELLLRYEPLKPGDDAHLLLFISEYETNKPVDSAQVSITSGDDSKLSFDVKQTARGQYVVETVFPEKKSYSLAVKVNAALGSDLLLLKDIEAGREFQPEGVVAQEGSAGMWMIAAALVAGIVIGVLLQRRSRRGKPVSVILLILYCSIPVQLGIAHEGHDNVQQRKSGGFSYDFHIPKETQFLFDVYTESVRAGKFAESTTLFGTIVPSSNGQAVISAPQNARVTSLKVKVGETVRKGQLLATIEQVMDAGTQVGLLSEKNSVRAEYEAAAKDVERLNSIKDIVAKRDYDEAQARYQRAKQNLELLTGVSGRSLNLTSPIDGIVGNFTATTGSMLSEGQPLFTVTDLSVVYAEAQVFDKDAEKVMEGLSFSVECANDDHKSGDVKLLSAGQEINSTNQSQKVLFEIKNPDGVFKIGEFVNIRVYASARSNQIALPSSSFTEVNGKPVVFAKTSAEHFQLRYVQPGENNGISTNVLKGVQEGERIAVNGNYQLKMIYLNQ